MTVAQDRKVRIAKVQSQHAKHFSSIAAEACLECDFIREIDSILAELDSAERVAVEFQSQLQMVECEWMRWARTQHLPPPRLRSLQCKCLPCNRCGRPSHNLAEHGRGICGPCEICGKHDGKATHGCAGFAGSDPND